jgi:HK97 family phage major capsid protein
VSKIMDSRAVRDAWRTKHRIAMLEAAGIDPREVGRVFNRANIVPSDLDRITIPTDGAGLEEMLADSTTMRNVFQNPAALKEFIKNYASTTQAMDPGISAQVQIETQRVMTAWLKDQEEKGAAPRGGKLDLRAIGNRIPTPGAKLPDTVYNEAAPGVALNGDFRNAGDFLRTVWHRNTDTSDERQAKMRKLAEIRNSFGSTVPADGGFLIPETLRAELLQVALENAIVRPRATVIPMESLRVPIPMIDSTTNATSVFGGIVCYWTEEAAQLVESQASFGRVVLDAKKLTGYAEIPNELIADAVAFNSFFEQKFPVALAWYEDVAFLLGSGVGEPVGAINCPASVNVAAEAGQPTATIVWENIVKMYARMLPASLSTAVWIASIDTFPQLATMALSVGTGGSAVWLGGTSPVGGASASPPMTILGRPVIFTEKTSPLGTAGDISFVDWSYYLIGDRQAMQVDSSPHYKFGNDKTAFRIIERVDGRPWLQSAITPRNSANTLTPFVQLATRP